MRQLDSAQPTAPKARSLRPWQLILLAGAWLATGCGNALYLTKIGTAEEKFQEAQQLGAEQGAPYDYYSAMARLEEARHQAADGEYGYAIRLARESKEYSQQAISELATTGRAARTGSRTPAPGPTQAPSPTQAAPRDGGQP